MGGNECRVGKGFFCTEASCYIVTVSQGCREASYIFLSVHPLCSACIITDTESCIWFLSLADVRHSWLLRYSWGGTGSQGLSGVGLTALNAAPMHCLPSGGSHTVLVGHNTLHVSVCHTLSLNHSEIWHLEASYLTLTCHSGSFSFLHLCCSILFAVFPSLLCVWERDW